MTRMKHTDWVYLGQLVRALQMEGVDGRRIGEQVAEIEGHMRESGADPVDEFGPPARLARDLAARPGSRRPGWVPPLWMAQIVVLALLLILLPLLTPWEWSADLIPVSAGAVAYAIVFYVGVFWIGYAANKEMDGRTWSSLMTAPRLIIGILGVAIVATTVMTIAFPEVLFSVPKTRYLVFAAVACPVLVGVLYRRNNPVRFPPHAAHLEPLRRGPLGGDRSSVVGRR